MCGIAGVHGYGHEAIIRQLVPSLIHRGPDSTGIFNCQKHSLSLGMTRLSILDYDGGFQPMSTPDKHHTIVYNGEIFNSRELRRKYLSDYHFKSDHSDTETLLALVSRIDLSIILQALNGMFAFALYESDKSKLFLAVDRFGIKPLYYSFIDGQLVFSSELKALKAVLKYTPSIRADAFISYMSLSYNTLYQSIYSDIYRLPPGHLLCFDLRTQSLSIERWFDHNSLCTRPQPVHIEDIERALVNSVRQWSDSDSDVSISLSGGLDSGLITAISAQTSSKVSTYTLSIPSPSEQSGVSSEAKLAKQLSDHYGTLHTEVEINPNDLLTAIPSMMSSIDEPYAGGLPSWFIYKEVQKKHKVVLNGVGGDEIFGDYGKWLGIEKLGPRLYTRIRRASAISQSHLNFRYYIPWCMTSDLSPYLSPHCSIHQTSLRDHFFSLFQSHSSHDIRKTLSLIDINTQLPFEFLFMTDRFSMAHSVEARTPFLDKNLTALSLSLSEDSKSSRQDPKQALRTIAKKYLPQSYIDHPKTGFTLPIAHWLKNELKEPVLDLLSTGHQILDETLCLSTKQINQFFSDETTESDPNLSSLLWKIYLFLVWNDSSLTNQLRAND